VIGGSNYAFLFAGCVVLYSCAPLYDGI